MAFMKPDEFSAFPLPYLPRGGAFPSPTAPLPSMNTFSNKRRHSENTTYEATLPLPPLKVPKLISSTSSLPPPPPLVTPGRGHSCTSDDCKYCSGLTNLDIAAFYWSMIAMRGYSKAKASSSYETPYSPNLPSPVCKSSTFDLAYKPPSPSGSLSSMDSEPLSPSSSTTSESSTSSTKDLGIKYQCQVCHKSYSHPRLLNRHLQSHTPYKKHHCPRCRKGFNDAFDLKRHIRTHTGIKPFQCRMCEKSFTQRCSLEAHMTRVHNVVHKFAFRERRPKLFVCEDCGVTFPDNNKFRQHEKESTCRPNKSN
eukprot:TCONS_00048891-protein